MKKLFASSLILMLLSFGTQKEDKRYKVELELSRWSFFNGGLEGVKQTLTNSELPSRTVRYLVDSIITPLQLEIVQQVSQQLPKDTTKVKK